MVRFLIVGLLRVAIDRCVRLRAPGTDTHMSIVHLRYTIQYYMQISFFFFYMYYEFGKCSIIFLQLWKYGVGCANR